MVFKAPRARSESLSGQSSIRSRSRPTPCVPATARIANRASAFRWPATAIVAIEAGSCSPVGEGPRDAGPSESPPSVRKCHDVITISLEVPPESCT